MTFQKQMRPITNMPLQDSECEELQPFYAARNVRRVTNRALKNVLGKRDVRERDLQRVIEQYPELLIQHLGGGHGRWVIPQKKLGADYVPDFLIAERLSFGFRWQAVELESPRNRMFTKRGDPSQHLVHAIRQIQDWRVWLKHNADYASRSRNRDGLGLFEINPNLPGLILIGRRDEVNPDTHNRRRQMMEENLIDIHTYDFLLEPHTRGPLWFQFNQPERAEETPADDVGK